MSHAGPPKARTVEEIDGEIRGCHIKLDAWEAKLTEATKKGDEAEKSTCKEQLAGLRAEKHDLHAEKLALLAREAPAAAAAAPQASPEGSRSAPFAHGSFSVCLSRRVCYSPLPL